VKGSEGECSAGLPQSATRSHASRPKNHRPSMQGLSLQGERDNRCAVLSHRGATKEGPRDSRAEAILSGDGLLEEPLFGLATELESVAGEGRVVPIDAGGAGLSDALFRGADEKDFYGGVFLQRGGTARGEA
jgi:hypothetical protein